MILEETEVSKTAATTEPNLDVRLTRPTEVRSAGGDEWTKFIVSSAPIIVGALLTNTVFMGTATVRGTAASSYRPYSRDYILIDDYRNLESLGLLKGIRSKVSDQLFRLLGDDGAARVEHFKLFSANWAGDVGKPFSHESLKVLNDFVESYGSLVPAEPSVFLTRAGNLQLGWKDAKGGIIELEFFPDKIEFYSESLHSEGATDALGITKLLSQV